MIFKFAILWTVSKNNLPRHLILSSNISETKVLESILLSNKAGAYLPFKKEIYISCLEERVSLEVNEIRDVVDKIYIHE